MTKEDLEAIFDRVRNWPAEKQEQAMDALLWIESDSDVYVLSDEERAAVQRGLDDSKNGRFATEEEMAALFQRDHPVR
jgi:predicted transcriptional regulator